MNKNQKKALYESIMRRVAVEVKKAINEGFVGGEPGKAVRDLLTRELDQKIDGARVYDPRSFKTGDGKTHPVETLTIGMDAFDPDEFAAEVERAGFVTPVAIVGLGQDKITFGRTTYRTQSAVEREHPETEPVFEYMLESNDDLGLPNMMDKEGYYIAYVTKDMRYMFVDTSDISMDCTRLVCIGL